jgi:hypothetical protein
VQENPGDGDALRVTVRHDEAMGTTVMLKVDTEGEAQAWATVLRTLGLRVGRPSNSPAVSSDGRWVIRALSPGDELGEQQAN